MRQNPRDQRDDGGESSGRHRTVIAAALRQSSGRIPVPGAPPRQPPGQSPDADQTEHERKQPRRPRRGGRQGGERQRTDAWSDAPAAEADRVRSGPDQDAWDAADQSLWAGDNQARWSDNDRRDRGNPRSVDERAGSHAPTLVIYDTEQGLYPNLPTGIASRDDSWSTAVVLEARPHGARYTLRRVAQVAVAAGYVVAGRSPGTTLIPGKPSASLAHVPRISTEPRLVTRPPTKRMRPWAVVGGCVALLFAVVVTGVANRGDLANTLTGSFWSTGTGAHALPTPIGGYWMGPIPSSAAPPPSFTDAKHYVAKYGFDWPAPGGSLWPGEKQRLAIMMPFAIAATARWDARFGDQLEPQMLLFWTHAEGISGRVSYSNCANESPPAGYSYFTYIANCNSPGFWQLGYGNQFGVIAILKTAFSDMRGNPNDPQLVQRVGQAVLDWDRRQGSAPACGGYSCTFPAMTIDQIMAGVSLTHPTADDWWASVLSRDPAINCYMLARALVWFSHNATRNWVGCYYAEPCWSYESNRLQDILVNWHALLQAANLA